MSIFSVMPYGHNIIEESLSDEADRFVDHIMNYAMDLYLSKRFLCAEAVVLALNNVMDGGMDENQIIAMTAPFSRGLGEGGCICGALAGAIMASGLFLLRSDFLSSRKQAHEISRQLHDAFKTANGAVCCRVLTRKVKKDRDAHFQQCSMLTAHAARLAATVILKKRPDLLTYAHSRPLATGYHARENIFSRLVHTVLKRRWMN